MVSELVSDFGLYRLVFLAMFGLLAGLVRLMLNFVLKLLLFELHELKILLVVVFGQGFRQNPIENACHLVGVLVLSVPILHFLITV